MFHTCWFWGSLRGAIEETGLLGYDAASRGVADASKGYVAFTLKGLGPPLLRPEHKLSTMFRIVCHFLSKRSSIHQPSGDGAAVRVNCLNYLWDKS